MSKLARLLRDRMRMVREDALAVAKVVEEAFAGHSELDDEQLDKDLRQVFYELQDRKVLDVRREERKVDGSQRRHYMWHLRDVDVDLPAPEHAVPEPAERLYLRLGDSAWERRQPAESAGPQSHP